MHTVSCFFCKPSDFWWDPVRKQSFGASIADFIAHRYEFRDGCCLFISHATRKTMNKSELAKMNGVFVISVCPYLTSNTSPNYTLGITLAPV